MPYSILIVDDDEYFRNELKDILGEDYEVFEAENGEKAVHLIKKTGTVDLVLLDYKMPGPKGTDVLKQIKKINPDIYVVMLTGYGRTSVMIESLRGYADDFLEKPLKIEQFLGTIDTILSQKQQDVTGIIEKIKYFIEKNYHKNISLKQAAETVFLSPKYISRIFRENTGKGFNEYKLQLKIKKAKALLRVYRFTINEISYKIGYRNVESFTRIFKKIEGCAPSEFRQKQKVAHGDKDR